MRALVAGSSPSSGSNIHVTGPTSWSKSSIASSGEAPGAFGRRISAPQDEIFGPTTASEAIRVGSVTDFRFFVVPKVVGGSLAALPADARLDLELVEHRVFGSGTEYLHYRRP